MHGVPSAVVFIALAILVVAARFGRHLTPVRALFPSWRFFDRAVLSPRLYVRVGGSADQLSAWTPVEIGPRSAAAFAFAPAANLALAYQSSIDRLVVELGEIDLEDSAGDIETDPRVTELVSYRLVDRIARAHAPRAALVQWKLVVPEVAGDYLVTPIAEHTA
jgi:hypothetical protein